MMIMNEANATDSPITLSSVAVVYLRNRKTRFFNGFIAEVYFCGYSFRIESTGLSVAVL